jgi:transcription antitermination factor NusG
MRWFVAQTYAGAEWQTHRALLRRGIESYLPHFVADTRRGRWVQATLKPQFPTYLFAGLAPGANMHEILSTLGVREIVRSTGEIVSLTDEQFKNIRFHCEVRKDAAAPRRTEIRRWKPGDVVPMPCGPFLGVPVQIRRIDKSGRISASMGSLSVTFHVFALHESVRKSSWHAQTCPG